MSARGEILCSFRYILSLSFEISERNAKNKICILRSNMGGGVDCALSILVGAIALALWLICGAVILKVEGWSRCVL